MTVAQFLARVRDCPLIASVQASEGSPLDHPETLSRSARASLKQGVRYLRIEGVKNLRTIRPEVKAGIIGLLKRRYEGSEVYITPTAQDVDAIAELGVDVIAFDGTGRARPGKDDLAGIVAHIHKRRKLAMADCDTVESALAAEAAGADLIGTTLAGYTEARAATSGPDLEVLRQICAAVRVPVIAEGRYGQRWEVEAALRIGAAAVTVGGALNDPVKQTRALLPTPRLPDDARVGAVDIGGTNLRFATFDARGRLLEQERVDYVPDREARLGWIRERLEESGVARLGVSTGGVVDPRTGTVVRAKEHLMPNHVGIEFSERVLGLPTVAWGDGHATAWGHANLPQTAGLRVATLALGTGVGCGFVQEGKIWCGRNGDYPRVNDLPTASGESYERRLGGKFLTSEPDDEAKETARVCLRDAVATLRGLYFADVVFVGGAVGLSSWMADTLADVEAVPSPFGREAGLYGAAALALYPPEWPR